MKAFRMRTWVSNCLVPPLAAMLVAGILTSNPAGAEAIRVSDGDTFWMGDDRIRLWGIDAPEWDTVAGRVAETFLRNQLAGLDASDLRCERRYRDPYERWVAQCFLPSGEDLACVLVRAGHARDWPKYSSGYYQRCKPDPAHF